MYKLKIEQVGLLLQAIYDSETHLVLEWMWDGGFEFRFGCMGLFDEHPDVIKELYKKIDTSKIEEVVSLILMEFEINHSISDTNGNLNPVGEFIATLLK